MTQTVPDISPLMPMHQDPLLVACLWSNHPPNQCWVAVNLLTRSLNQAQDDVMKWKLFPRYWSFVRGIHRSPVNSPHKGKWRGALVFSLICARIKGWVNNREAGDFRRHHAHYCVIVMKMQQFASKDQNEYRIHRIQNLYCQPLSLPIISATEQ